MNLERSDALKEINELSVEESNCVQSDNEVELELEEVTVGKYGVTEDNVIEIADENRG